MADPTDSFSMFTPQAGSTETLAGAGPDHLAIVDGARTITYPALHARANQVARFLRERGVRPDQKIGVAIGRSIDFVIAVLGIAKAGAAYVPLDPAYPLARLAFMLKDAAIDLVFSACAPLHSITADPRVSCVSIEAAAILSQSDEAIESTPGAEQIAYVIYTSGTTGTPKGVEITYGNLRNLVRWHREAFEVTASDRGALIANVGFDAAVWELWPYLATGATLLIPSQETIRDPETVREWIVENEVSIAFIPTLLAEVLTRLSWPQTTALRYMLTGGDTLRRPPRAGLPFRLVNNYGPAECTVVATSGVIPGAPSGHQLPDIGRPILGVQIYFLDSRLNEVPTGAVGEICIGGEGVGRGYLNQPELTEQKFIRWTRRDEPLRLYRTGDTGSLRDDGSLHFLGRLDDQVQIRGYRIERGEVEAALNSLPSVQTSAVLARDYGGGDLRLVAYIVPAHNAVLSRQALRSELRLRLPEYMVPLEFMRVAELPVSENGKIDRQQLLAQGDATLVTTLHAVETPVEAELIAILKKLLNIDSIDREDNFFLLGGHSFIAAQVIARVRSRFDVELSLRTVFDHPTPRAMAQQIEQSILARL